MVYPSVKKDEVTFSCEFEKDFFLCMLKHFFTIHDFNNFYHWDIDSETYNEFYREIVKLHIWDMDMESLEEIVKDIENNKENAHETC